MADDSKGPEAGQVKAPVRFLSSLALIRTVYSSERSLMAWIRTSVSLYTFGFSISKFIDYLELQEKGIQFPAGFRRVGLVLIAMGIVALLFAMFDHLRRVQKMRQLGLPSTMRSFLPSGAATALVLTGIVMLIGVWSS
ncbi:MAG: YidH family protein [Planctomycetota bacterium]